MDTGLINLLARCMDRFAILLFAGLPLDISLHKAGSMQPLLLG